AESGAIGKRRSIPAPPRRRRPGQTRPATEATGRAQSRPTTGTILPATSGILRPSFRNPPGAKQSNLRLPSRRPLKYHNRSGTQPPAPTKDEYDLRRASCGLVGLKDRGYSEIIPGTFKNAYAADKRSG